MGFKRKFGRTLPEEMEVNLLEFQEASGMKHVVSFCPDHGEYTKDNLCACYDENGKKDGYGYGEAPLDGGILGGPGFDDDFSRN